MTYITAEILTALSAALPTWTFTMTSKEVPSGRVAGGTFWTATVKIGNGESESASSSDDRAAMMSALAALTKLPPRRGGNAEVYDAAKQARRILADMTPDY